MKCIAHLTSLDGERKEQSLEAHCVDAAEYAVGSIGEAKLYNTVYLAGILHDAGKAKEEYKKYLEAAFQGEDVKRGTVNHTFAGVILLFEKFHREESTKWDKLTCEIIGYAIGAHHGMFDCTDLDGKNGFLYRLQKDREEIGYEESVRNFFSQVVQENVIEAYFCKAVKEVEEFFKEARNEYGSKAGAKVFFQISMLVRLVLSAVIYGDRRDTCEFMTQKKSCQVRKPDLGWTYRKEYFEAQISKFDSSSLLNKVRSDISRQCLEAAERGEGIYRLNVPTGAGKTLCTLRYALAHAEKYHKKRIIFIIPLLSVLDQNAKVIREYIPEGKEVLEHHSNVVRETEKSRGAEDDDLAQMCEFLRESWDSPIVVSTLVQLLNILFSHQTAAIGRFQALCDSVIVIDEVQSLPGKMTVMFNMAMNFLRQYCNASIVLSSATQPCFEELKWSMHLADNPDLVCLNPAQLQVFRRAEIIDRTDSYGMDWDQCTEFCEQLMEQHISLLVICNTKAQAKNLYTRLQELADAMGCDIFHLSTAMCQKHRMEELEGLKSNLVKLQQTAPGKGDTKRCICISTQLIEAGVDISFECVVRILAGVDNLAQVAGRCNRSNEYGKTGKVYLIHLKDENLSMLREIKNAQNSTRRVIEDLNNMEKEITAREETVTENSLIGEWATRQFYRYLFQETGSEVKYPISDCGTTFYLADLLFNYNGSAENEENRKYILHQPLKTIGREFKVFEEDTIDIIVPYKEGKYWIERLKEMQKERFDIEKFGDIIQEIKKYTVSIYEWQRRKLDQAGMLERIFDDRILVLDGQAYDDKLGLTVLEEQPVKNYVL